jgi:hypothetical protein
MIRAARLDSFGSRWHTATTRQLRANVPTPADVATAGLADLDANTSVSTVFRCCRGSAPGQAWGLAGGRISGPQAACQM